MTMKKTDLKKEVILSKVINLKCMRIKVLCDSDFSYLEGNTVIFKNFFVSFMFEREM